MTDDGREVFPGEAEGLRRALWDNEIAELRRQVAQHLLPVIDWKEAARRFRRRWRNVEHNWKEATREIFELSQRLGRQYMSIDEARTDAARKSNQLAVVATLVQKYRRRELDATTVIGEIETMLRENKQ